MAGMARIADSKYRRFTESEIEAANDIDLPELLSTLGYHVKPIGRYYTTVEMDSLRVKDSRTWFRYSESVGGDAIAFLRHFHGMSFPEAVRFLLAFNGYPMDSHLSRLRQNARPPPPREQPAFVLPAKHSDNKMVRSYLKGRGVAPSVIESFIKMGLLYEGRKHHDCVFVGRDKTGKPVFAAKRGTCDSFKGDVAGSDKSVAFRLPCEAKQDTVSVFESPIDLMSWFTLYGPSNAVALCGLHDAPLETYLHENPLIKRIVICLDADMRGCKAAKRIGTKYQALGYETENRVPPTGKDWNEYLQMER